MRKLTLTFDNGPFADVTPGVLDVLGRRGIGATFFVCGKDIEDDAQRAIVRRARDEGHRIGNHTYSHSVELGATADSGAPEAEIGRAQRVLGELADADCLFRPYGGGGVIGPRLLSQEAVRYLCAGGYTCVLWSSVPRDWEDPQGWPERALSQLGERDWTTVVLHDVPTGAMKQLERFLDLVEGQGVEIVQQFPSDCVPIDRGKIVLPIEEITP